MIFSPFSPDVFDDSPLLLPQCYAYLDGLPVILEACIIERKAVRQYQSDILAQIDAVKHFFQLGLKVSGRHIDFVGIH